MCLVDGVGRLSLGGICEGLETRRQGFYLL